jgi:hypothetical protein
VVDLTIVDIVPESFGDLERAARDQASLKKLIDQGKARLVTTLQLRARSAATATARVGHRVPVPVQNLQYENVGLNVEATPRIFSDYIEVRLRLEMSATNNGSPPTFLHRQLDNTLRVTPGSPVVAFGLANSYGFTFSDAPPKPGSPFASGSFAVILSARVD